MSIKILLRQWVRKQIKMFSGLINSSGGSQEYYRSESWWDSNFYSAGIKSDASTISRYTPEVVSRFHYNSIELGLCAYFFNHEIDLVDARVCDLGSGSGHWLEFYSELGATDITGIDISHEACEYLRDKYIHNMNIRNIYCGKALTMFSPLDAKFDVINAVGVMFHIIDDEEWESTINDIAAMLNNGGVFVVGGHFGLLDGVNVQFDTDKKVNKRLRSKARWTRALKKAGFKKVHVWRNRNYLRINWLVPESNIIFAIK